MEWMDGWTGYGYGYGYGSLVTILVDRLEALLLPVLSLLEEKERKKLGRSYKREQSKKTEGEINAVEAA